MLKMLSAMTGHLKIKLGEQESTANKDVIAKAALLNMFHHGFDMVESFHDDEDDGVVVPMRARTPASRDIPMFVHAYTR